MMMMTTGKIIFICRSGLIMAMGDVWKGSGICCHCGRAIILPRCPNVHPCSWAAASSSTPPLLSSTSSIPSSCSNVHEQQHHHQDHHPQTERATDRHWQRQCKWQWWVYVTLWHSWKLFTNWKTKMRTFSIFLFWKLFVRQVVWRRGILSPGDTWPAPPGGSHRASGASCL